MCAAGRVEGTDRPEAGAAGGADDRAVGLMDSRRIAGYATLLHHDAVIGCLREAGSR